MSDDVKALRALVEVSRGDGGRGTLARCCLCGYGNGHERHCPVPAAEAALDRLEASFAFEPAGPMLAALRKQERIGYEKARDQAAAIVERSGPSSIPYDERGEESYNNGVMDAVAYVVKRIRAMEPEP